MAKVAVYAIGLNEAHNLRGWYESAKEADVVLYADTGSTDGSLELAKELGIETVSITVKPWRFDVAKNTALNLLPSDVEISVSLDLDERLLPGWRDEVEYIWVPGTTSVTHKYRHNGRAWQWHSKIHARHGCHWKGVVHEELFWNIEENTIWSHKIFLDEVQDLNKDRSGYMELLEKKVAEGDTSWRTLYFLANEYESQGELDASIAARIDSFVACGDEPVTKAYIARTIGRNLVKASRNEEAHAWFQRSVAISDEREGWFYYAEFLYSTQAWEECFVAAKRCLKVSTKRDGFTYDALAWGYLAYDYVAISAWHMKDFETAVAFGERALELEPDNQRLKDNLEWYKNGE